LIIDAPKENEMEIELNLAIDSAFDPTGIDAFIGGLNQRSARVTSLLQASSDLTEFLPASAFKPGAGDFTASFLTEFQRLDSAGQRRVEGRYQSAVECVPGGIRAKYPRVFR
jgi:hypothetical protein